MPNPSSIAMADDWAEPERQPEPDFPTSEAIQAFHVADRTSSARSHHLRDEDGLRAAFAVDIPKIRADERAKWEITGNAVDWIRADQTRRIVDALRNTVHLPSACEWGSAADFIEREFLPGKE